MRRTLLGLLVAVLVAAGSTLVATPAQAASKPVTIKKLSTRWIDWNGTAVVKPHVRKTKGVKVLTTSMTIRRDGHVVRRNRGVVKLRPGTYRVTTKVTYEHQGKKHAVSAQQRLLVKQGRCATKANYRSIKVTMRAGSGDAVATVAKKVRNSGVLVSDAIGEMTLRDWRDFLAAEAPELGASFDALIALYGEDALLDFGTYRVCQNKRKTVDVIYIDGHAVDKSVEEAA